MPAGLLRESFQKEGSNASWIDHVLYRALQRTSKSLWKNGLKRQVDLDAKNASKSMRNCFMIYVFQKLFEDQSYEWISKSCFTKINISFTAISMNFLKSPHSSVSVLSAHPTCIKPARSGHSHGLPSGTAGLRGIVPRAQITAVRFCIL